MTNEQVWAQYKEYTEQASSVARRLGFAVSGLLWAASGSADGWTGLARTGFTCAILFFAADFFQYAFASIRRRSWIRREEERLWNAHESLEGEYLAPVALDRPIFVLWYVKFCLLIATFICAGIALWAPQ